MCYSDNDRPPLPPGERGSAEGEDLVLTADDGTRFSAYAALAWGIVELTRRVGARAEG